MDELTRILHLKKRSHIEEALFTLWHNTHGKEQLAIDAMNDHAALLAAAREAEEASRIIFDVSAKVSLPNLQIACPHGAIPLFPSHAWWCDKCFYRLNDALDALAALIEK